MKSRIILIIFTALAAIPAYAMRANTSTDPQKLPQGKISLELKGSYGQIEGEAREIVYQHVEDYGAHKLSELIWDISSLYMAGAVASVDFDKMFKISAGYWAAVNEGEGEMTDYDWMSLERPDAWTHFSRSEVEVTDASMADISISVPVLFYDKMCFSGVAGYKNDFWKWTDSAQEYIYSSGGGFRDLTGNFGGSNLIIYEQSFSFPYLGVEATYAQDRLNLSFYATFSNMVEAEDVDQHLARGLKYTGSFSEGSYAGIGAEATYSLSPVCRIGGGLDYQLISEITGDLKIEQDGSTAQVHEDSAAVSHESMMLSAVLIWAF